MKCLDSFYFHFLSKSATFANLIHCVVCSVENLTSAAKALAC